MSATRKRTLFIALGSLLASSTAVAVLTFQTDAGVGPDAASSGSTPHTLPAPVAENVDVAGHTAETLALLDVPSGESERYSNAVSPPAGSNEAPVVRNFSVDTPTRSEAVEAPQGAAAPSSVDDGFGPFENRFSLNYGGFGGGGRLAGSQNPFQPGSSTPKDPLTDIDSSVPTDTNAQRPDPIPGGGDTPDGPCDALTSCGSSDDVPGDDVPGSVPGDDSPNGGSPDPITVPEPGSMGLLAFGLALAGFMGRRRRAPI